MMNHSNRTSWTKVAILILLCVCLWVPTRYTDAAEQNVKVTLPTFNVTLNGHAIDNEYREYPLLVYKGITYFPMTWFDARLLGLEVVWSPDRGLDIKQSFVTSSYVPYASEQRNRDSYTATIITSAVTINGKPIDNTKEEYPLLGFRNVVYFPLTWRFAHDEFGWEYQWDSNEGLRITSHNPQLQTVSLPDHAREHDVALFKGYVYFVEVEDLTTHIYRAPFHNPADKQEIYAYPLNGLVHIAPTFQIRGNELWFTYFLGGSDARLKSGHRESRMRQ